MNSIKIVVAVDDNWLIGNSTTNKMPGWKLPADLQNFKKLTVGHSVGSGRKTFESVPEKWRPLPDRHNFIISRNHNYTPVPNNDNAFAVPSLEEAIQYAEIIFPEEIFYLIGGGELYAYALNNPDIIVDEIIITRVHGVFEGDVYFPKISETEWQLISSVPYPKDEKNSHDFTTERYVPITV